MRIIPESELDPFAFQRPDWGLWLSGQTIQISQGEDFTSSLDSMRSYLYAQAKMRGLKVIVRLDRAFDRITFRSYQEGEQIPYIPATKEDFDSYQAVATSIPTCRICSALLTPFSVNYGECATIRDGLTHANTEDVTQ